MKCFRCQGTAVKTKEILGRYKLYCCPACDVIIDFELIGNNTI
jgi:hypothetical protein